MSTINNVNDKICFICFSMTFLNDIYDDAYSKILRITVNFRYNSCSRAYNVLNDNIGIFIFDIFIIR